MIVVKMLYYNEKEGKSYRSTFQAADMYSAVELLRKFNEVLYDEGYNTSDVNMEEESPV